MAVPEILAPAGSADALLAALRCGADAVYVGGKQYSARQSAENFDLEALAAAVSLCHLYGAKLYLTVNTLLLDSELEAFEAYIRAVAAIGVDACIVQDPGAAMRIRQIAPELPLHASTQMTIHTAQGALWAKEQGFCRVVTARELSRAQLLPILDCDIEVEHFVHGALCMSVSGQCYLSAMIGSRSANRGRCAQACRLPFSAKTPACRTDCALSLKDQSLVSHMQQLMQDAVTSLKIEGRMKRPEYVAAAVTALYQARCGEAPDLELLRAVFSRSGFTDGYYTGTRKEMFGVREKEDVLAAKDALPQLQQCYRKPRHCIGLTMQVTCCTDAPVTLTVTSADGVTVTVSGAVVEAARSKPADEAYLRRQLEKLGDTVYTLEAFSCTCDGVGMLPASALNALRRDAVAQLDAARIRKHTPVYTLRDAAPPTKTEPVAPAPAAPLPFLRVRVRTLQQLAALETFGAQLCRIIPLEIAESVAPAPGDLLQMPRFTLDEPAQMQQLSILRKQGWQHLLCENPAHLRIGAALDYTLHGGMDLHTANHWTIAYWKQYGLCDVMLSPELTIAQGSRLTGTLPVGVYAYGKLPVMLLRCCPIQHAAGCKQCSHQLTDRTGRSFPVLCRKDYTELCNAVPVWMADRMQELSYADFLLLDLTDETDARQIAAICNAYRSPSAGKPEAITRGLLYRGIE